MRNRPLTIGIAAVIALSIVPLLAPAQQGQEQTIEGTLKSVDIENSTVVVTPEGQADVTLSVTEDTVLRDEAGTEIDLDALVGREGVTLAAVYEAREESNVALSIEIRAS